MGCACQCWWVVLVTRRQKSTYDLYKVSTKWGLKTRGLLLVMVLSPSSFSISLVGRRNWPGYKSQLLGNEEIGPQRLIFYISSVEWHDSCTLDPSMILFLNFCTFIQASFYSRLIAGNLFEVLANFIFYGSHVFSVVAFGANYWYDSDENLKKKWYIDCCPQHSEVESGSGAGYPNCNTQIAIELSTKPVKEGVTGPTMVENPIKVDMSVAFKKLEVWSFKTPKTVPKNFRPSVFLIQSVLINSRSPKALTPPIMSPN